MEKRVERRSKADDIDLDTHSHHCCGAALGRIGPIQRQEIVRRTGGCSACHDEGWRHETEWMRWEVMPLLWCVWPARGGARRRWRGREECSSVILIWWRRMPPCSCSAQITMRCNNAMAPTGG